MKRLLTALILIVSGVSVARATVANVSADAHVTSTLPSTNFGTRSNLAVNSTSTAYLRFDLTNLPASTTSSQVSKAVLYVYVNRVYSTGTLYAYGLSSAFSESSVTYNNRPTAANASQSGGQVSSAGSFLAFDVTSLLQGWLSTSGSNYGIALATSVADVLLDSKENDLTGHAAYIDVTLANSGAAGVNGATGATGATGSAGTNGINGATGATGATGVGAAGATGATGATGAAVGGTYSASVSYVAGSVVTYNGTTYLAIAASTGVTPGTNSSDWVATGGGSSTVNYLNALYTANATVNTNSYFPISGITATSGSGLSGSGTTITIATPGVYEIAYTVNLVVQSGGTLAEAALYVNGASTAYLQVAGSNGAQLAGHTIVTITSPSTVQLFNMTPQAVTIVSGDISVVSLQGAAGTAGAAGTTGATGAAGATGVGLTGANGATGATGSTGTIGVVTNYLTATTYSAGTVVYCQASGQCSTSAQGSSYVYVNATPSAGHDPYSNTTYWQQIAAAGLNGTNGSNGATGATGATGAYTGSAILNQTTQQAGANFNIDGSGVIGGKLTVSNGGTHQSIDTGDGSIRTNGVQFGPSTGTGYGKITVSHGQSESVIVPWTAATVTANPGMHFDWADTGPRLGDTTDCAGGITNSYVVDNSGNTTLPGQYSVTFTPSGNGPAITGTWEGYEMRLFNASGTVVAGSSPAVVHFTIVNESGTWHLEHMMGTVGTTAFECH